LKLPDLIYSISAISWLARNMELNNEEIRRYSRHLILPEVGLAGQKKIKGTSVLCIGAGGLGSPISMYIAAAGIGKIGIVDFDTVDYSNLQRQILHTDADVGRSKAESAKETIRGINPHCEVVIHNTRITSENALDLIRPYDIVVDGTDNFPTRYLTNDACVLLKKPNVYGSIFRFEGQASVFAPHLGGPCYRCLYPEPPPPGMVPSCAEGGVLGVLPGIIGCIQATEILKLAIGRGTSLVGRLRAVQCARHEVPRIKIQRRQGRRALGGLFAFAGAARQFRAGVPHGAFKHAVVIRPGGGNEFIFRRERRTRLQQFLQFALGIFNVAGLRQRAEIGGELAQHKFPRRLKAAIQKNRAEQRLERVRQRRRRVRGRRCFPRPGSKSGARRGRARAVPASEPAFTSLARDLVSAPSSAREIFRRARATAPGRAPNRREIPAAGCAASAAFASCATDGCVSARRSRFSSRKDGRDGLGVRRGRTRETFNLAGCRAPRRRRFNRQSAAEAPVPFPRGISSPGGGFRPCSSNCATSRCTASS
jgi:molybdopterin/thiamine biosynthesis adenylyltransferase